MSLICHQHLYQQMLFHIGIAGHHVAINYIWCCTDVSDVVGASPVDADPTAYSLTT